MRLVLGDSLDVLRTLDAGSVDALVTDPPAGIGFMGKEWDTPGALVERRPDRSVAFDKLGGNHNPENNADKVRTNRVQGRKFRAALQPIFEECLRVLKPGAHGLVWALPRTSHWTATALEDAGFEIRDVGVHLFGTGFPKSLNIGDGRGTALKPASEHWLLVRKPLEGTVAETVLAHGTGALNIDGCRIAGTDAFGGGAKMSSSGKTLNAFGEYEHDGWQPGNASGRWPANLTLDEEAAALLDEQSGDSLSTGGVNAGGLGDRVFGKFAKDRIGASAGGYGDSGGASRFFYVAKPDRSERDIGCEGLPAASGGEATARVDGSAGLQNPRAGAGRNGGARNIHPTVKPVDLMRWLCRLITPKGGLVLDPFMGSGTTGVACAREGFRFIGIEREPQYMEIARRRIHGDAPLFNRPSVTEGAA